MKWTSRTTGSLPAIATVVCVWISTPGAENEPARAARRASPGGTYELRFEMVAHRTFSREQQLHRLENTNHIEYAIDIVSAATGETVTTVRYADVYGFNQPPEPTPLNRISQWFEWSPEEDFVILPVEGWASAPGTPESTVVALNPDLGWSRSWFTMDEVTWAGPLVAVGNRHQDCDYSVDVFDGRTGEQVAVVAHTSPIGYQIESVGDRHVVIRKVLDNCASPQQRAAFEPRCLSLDLDTLALGPAPCGI